MLPIAIQPSQVSILLSGRGKGLMKRAQRLLEEPELRLEVYSDAADDTLRELLGKRLVERLPDLEEVGRARLVMLVDLPEEHANAIASAARQSGALVNVEDVKEQCDFYFMSEVRRGDLQIAISTNGKSPGLAVSLREYLEQRVDESWADKLDALMVLRQQWRDEGLPMKEVLARTRAHIVEQGWLPEVAPHNAPPGVVDAPLSDAPGPGLPSVSRLQSFYGGMDAESLLRVMIGSEFAGRIAVSTSFGTDSSVLLSLVAKVAPDTPVFFLDTGKHFPETLAYGRQLEEQLGLTNVQWLTPDATMEARIDPQGALWSSQPNRCCWMRKVEPLNRAIKEQGIVALITGRKRFQTKDRAEMQTVEWDGEKARFAINPLADWTREDISRYMDEHRLPRQPLIEQGYRSIGCAPCTKPVREGEDERAGRWAHTAENGEQKQECGLHVPLDWSV